MTILNFRSQLSEVFGGFGGAYSAPTASPPSAPTPSAYLLSSHRGYAGHTVELSRHRDGRLLVSYKKVLLL
jgi:hypothetical protein